MIDITALAYSDAIIYKEDYMSNNPIFNITEDEIHRISEYFGIDCSGFKPQNKRFLL